VIYKFANINKNMRSKFLIIIFLQLFVSCTNDQIGDSIDSNATKVIQFNESNSEDGNKSDNNDFQKFWNEFRKALIENDEDKIQSMTVFPFETRGEMDSDSIVKYDKTDFKKVLRAYLLQETYWLNEDQSITQFEEIKRTIHPNASQVQGNEARIGNLEFELRDNHWKLVFAYLNLRDDLFWKR